MRARFKQLLKINFIKALREKCFYHVAEKAARFLIQARALESSTYAKSGRIQQAP